MKTYECDYRYNKRIRVDPKHQLDAAVHFEHVLPVKCDI